jgi:hypothetical protein
MPRMQMVPTSKQVQLASLRMKLWPVCVLLARGLEGDFGRAWEALSEWDVLCGWSTLNSLWTLQISIVVIAGSVRHRL